MTSNWPNYSYLFSCLPFCSSSNCKKGKFISYVLWLNLTQLSAVKILSYYVIHLLSGSAYPVEDHGAAGDESSCLGPACCKATVLTLQLCCPILSSLLPNNQTCTVLLKIHCFSEYRSIIFPWNQTPSPSSHTCTYNHTVPIVTRRSPCHLSKYGVQSISHPSLSASLMVELWAATAFFPPVRTARPPWRLLQQL